MTKGVSTKFKPGVSGNIAGRPKGSKNAVTLLKLMAEEGARERNFAKMMAVVDDTVERALAGDKECRKLVWQAVMSKGSVDDRQHAQEKVEININALPATAGVVIEAKSVEVIQ